ncbi:MAG: hypothetical protein GY811_30615 [Myxococcales bacterium]|nr:hypothetical protein [Myxococcales bacterium]
MRSADGHYTLIDFGLAQREEAGSRLTIEGQVLGTPSYLPPKQARGEMDIDGRSDLWSRASACDRDTALSLVSSLVTNYFPEVIATVSDDEPEPFCAEVLEGLLTFVNREERGLCADFLAEPIGVPTRESIQV